MQQSSKLKLLGGLFMLTILFFLLLKFENGNLRYAQKITGIDFEKYAESYHWNNDLEFCLAGKILLKENFNASGFLEKSKLLSSSDILHDFSLLPHFYPDLLEEMNGGKSFYYLYGSSDQVDWELVFDFSEKIFWLVIIYPDYSGDFIPRTEDISPE